MSWKSALVGSFLALGSQTALANKPLPCPTTGPIQDTIWVVQWDIRQKIDNRLRSIDIQKRHQVVVVTVKNVGEYGFGSIEEMANKLGTGCSVGYRWENTGVVILYAQIPSRYKIETADTQRYITDAHSGRIITHSKTEGVCKKEDVACRLDDITKEIDILIRRQFPDVEAVHQIDTAIQKEDEARSNREMNELLWNLGIGAVIIGVLGTWTFGIVKGVSALHRNNRRKELKKQIFELFTHLMTEKQKYPAWFQNECIKRSETIITELQGYSDEQLDHIAQWEWATRQYEKNIRLVQEAIASWQNKLTTILSRLEQDNARFNRQREQCVAMNRSLVSQWYIFPAIEIPAVESGENPADSLRKIEAGLSRITHIQSSLEELPRYYASAEGFDTKIQSQFDALIDQHAALSTEYVDIFGTSSGLDTQNSKLQLSQITSQFRELHAKKDIVGMRSAITRCEALLNPFVQANRAMSEKISWYRSIPLQLTRREQQISSVRPNRQYVADASDYAQKTGKRNFLHYDLAKSLADLRSLIEAIRNFHAQKQNLEKIDPELKKFDREYTKMEEYMGLGTLLAALIAEELRKQKEAEEEEERRKKRREADDANSITSVTIPSPSPSPGWTSWGGGGFSGGGATDD